VPKRGGWEFSSYAGDTPDLLACPYLMTIDVVKNQGVMRVFQFEDIKSCELAVEQMKLATKDLPKVIVIDKNCKAHIAK
jgi:hypothetical protein